MFNEGTGQHQFSSSKLLCLYIFFHIFMSYDGHVILFITDYFAHLYFVTYTYTVLPRSIAPHFIANLAYRQNSRLSLFPPLKIPRYTAKLSYRHPPQVFRHKSRKTNLNSPISTAHNYLLTAVY